MFNSVYINSIRGKIYVFFVLVGIRLLISSCLGKLLCVFVCVEKMLIVWNAFQACNNAALFHLF